MKWFKQQNSSPSAANVIPTVPYHEKMKQSREDLHWLVKKTSNIVSTAVYSEMRELERTLEDVNNFLIDHKANAADEHMLDSIMKDYLPSAIELFSKLPEQARKDGGEGDTLLLKQCRTMAQDLRRRNEELHERATIQLRTQAAFIEERFSEANLT